MILLVVDGLTSGAVEKIPLNYLGKLKQEGVYYKELYLSLAAHPKQNNDVNDPCYYPWSSSIPNPVMMTGTVFIGQTGIKETLLQYSYRSLGKNTAFLVNSNAYEEIAIGYDLFRQDWTSDDDSPVFEAAQKTIKETDPWFIRIHLQTTGAGGYRDMRAGLNIWEQFSDYRARVTKADSLIFQFVQWLKANDYWEETVLFICGDHGQSDKGGHPPFEPGGDKTSLLILGKGIKKGVSYDYAEMIDIAPTIAFFKMFQHQNIARDKFLKKLLLEKKNYKNEKKILKS
ncbi:MAG: sulfatase-like hydrolase/transferase [Bacteroidales bacterium]|nr:sulfatase-like hydrolase/transferase [Bacteroidales bacterium]